MADSAAAPIRTSALPADVVFQPYDGFGLPLMV